MLPFKIVLEVLVREVKLGKEIERYIDQKIKNIIALFVVDVIFYIENLKLYAK